MKQEQELLDSYRKLRDLLHSQAQALEGQGDSQKLAALAPLISEYSKRVAACGPALAGLAKDRRKPIDDCLAEISRLIEVNRQGWTRRLQQLEGQRDQLRSARRFAKQAYPARSENPVRLLNRTG